MSYTKKDLQEKSLIELRYICKKHKITIGTKKSTMIKNILDFFSDPEPIINSNKILSLPQGKKIVPVKINEKEKLIEVGKHVEKGTAKILYYSFGVLYYVIDEHFNFV